MDKIPGPDANTLGYIVELDANNHATDTRLDFHFNPDTLTLAQGRGGGGANAGSSATGGSQQGPWAPAGSQKSPQANSSSGSNSGVQPGGHARPGGSATNVTLAIGNLYFDSGYEGGSNGLGVLPEIQKLFNWFKPSTNGPKTTNTPSPPNLRLYIGGFPWITGTLSQATVKFLIFTPNGRPTRAQVTNLTIQGDEATLGSQNPTSGGLASYSAVTIGAGDSLESIAYKTYGHARLWRQLALVNGIDDPLRVRPGMTVMLPTLNEIVKVG